MSESSKLEEIRVAAVEDIQKLKVHSHLNLELIEEVRVKYLGRNAGLICILKNLSQLSPDVRPQVGKIANETRKMIESEISALRDNLVRIQENQKLVSEKIDVTLAGRTHDLGSFHPVSLVISKTEEIFARMGFGVEEGPEIENEFYNFEALNIPKNHPARAMHDTFYVSQNVVLRTHTSNVQIRVMQNKKPPLRFLSAGATYRHDTLDVTHSPMFHQMEGLCVDEKVSLSHLKGVLTAYLQAFFGDKTKVRFRPSFFPFTEPSAEVDISCVSCSGKGCRMCKESGWLEVLGCGMVHDNVFRAVKYNPQKISGFAFGMGVERLAMLKYQISDIRLFFENDVRFLKQFRTAL
ncbi:MAG: phenylalanine--tRNA ligase subunit alpha [Deltaproteobacteria bacterium]|nr:phenylalanine--tRNA ligase subunit alpha [Deltaproteobacteria bacterium]